MEHKAILTRRDIVGGAAAGTALVAARPALAAAPVFAMPRPVQPQINAGLLARARAALDSKSGFIRHRDVIGITDFSRASKDARFYLVDVASGMTTEYHVAHGRGSDPAHTGWLERFSNEIGSEASSAGAYLTEDVYYGKYGRSLRLKGLDYSNSNAEERAIVIHGAWYADPKVIEQHGKLGRSEGCFAMPGISQAEAMTRLGSGRLLYAEKAA